MAITRKEIAQYRPEPGLLAERNILITGAGDGIGRAVALDAAKGGATIILVGKTVAKLERVYDEIIESGGPEPIIFPLDLKTSNWDHYQAMAAALKEQIGQLNGLVINAATVPTLMPFEQITPQMYSDLMTINLHAPFLMVQACLELMRDSHDPSLVFSTHRSNRAYWGSFGIAKAGLVGMMDILAHEMDVENRPLRVNGVDAGAVYTNLRRMIVPGDSDETVNQPEDITAPYLYFLGPDSKDVSGINLELADIDA